MSEAVCYLQVRGDCSGKLKPFVTLDGESAAICKIHAPILFRQVLQQTDSAMES